MNVEARERAAGVLGPAKLRQLDGAGLSVVWAWKPGGDGSYKRCPRCDEPHLEGQVQCQECGLEPEDDMTWRTLGREKADA